MKAFPDCFFFFPFENPYYLFFREVMHTYYLFKRKKKWEEEYFLEVHCDLLNNQKQKQYLHTSSQCFMLWPFCLTSVLSQREKLFKFVGNQFPIQISGGVFLIFSNIQLLSYPYQISNMILMTILWPASVFTP